MKRRKKLQITRQRVVKRKLLRKTNSLQTRPNKLLLKLENRKRNRTHLHQTVIKIVKVKRLAIPSLLKNHRRAVKIVSRKTRKEKIVSQRTRKEKIKKERIVGPKVNLKRKIKNQRNLTAVLSRLKGTWRTEWRIMGMPVRENIQLMPN